MTKTALLGYSRPLIGGAVGSGLVGALLIGATAPLLGYLMWALAFYLLLVLLVSGKTRTVPAEVAIEPSGVVVDGKLALAKADVASAYLQPRQGQRPLVRVRSRRFGGNLDIVTEDEAHGRQILTALGQDASRVVAKFRVRSGIENKTFRVVWGAASMILWVGMRSWFSSPWVMGAFGVTWLGMIAASFLPTTITVGADGVLIDKLWQRRFVPFSTIESIGVSAAHADAIVLYLRREGRDPDGKGEIEIRTRPNDKKTTLRGPIEARDAVRERLAQAFAAYGARERSDDAAALLTRGSRSNAEWLGSLKSFNGDAGYRAPAIPAEQLWRIAEDPRAEPSARAGALITLRESLDDEGHTRLRAAVQGCASPRVRVALDAATHGDEQALTDALDQLEWDEVDRAQA